MNSSSRSFVPRNQNSSDRNIQPLTQFSENQNLIVPNIQPSTQFLWNQNPIFHNIQPSTTFLGNQNPIFRNIQPSTQFLGNRNPIFRIIRPSTTFSAQPYGVHNMRYVQPLRPTINHVQKPYSIQSRTRDQIHYYFSKDNLCRDVYLRRHMDEEGFVPLQFIATFPKIKALCSNVGFILDSLKDSPIVEVKGEFIRTKNDWERFVLSPEQRIVWSADTNKE